jgi:hypothetical protein
MKRTNKSIRLADYFYMDEKYNCDERVCKNRYIELSRLINKIMTHNNDASNFNDLLKSRLNTYCRMTVPEATNEVSNDLTLLYELCGYVSKNLSDCINKLNYDYVMSHKISPFDDNEVMANVLAKYGKYFKLRGDLPLYMTKFLNKEVLEWVKSDWQTTLW